MPGKLDAIAEADFTGVEIFEHDFLVLDAWPCRIVRNKLGERQIKSPCSHTSEPRAVTQKPGPSPAVRDVPPTIYRPSPDKLDRTPPIAARAPEVSL